MESFDAVRVGSMLFTLVDPQRGHEAAYNRWYERDHFYAGCMIGPWLFAGKRFVATRALKNLRLPAKSPVAEPVDAGSYLAIYWVHADHHAEHFEWAGKQVHWLYANDRGFAERSHVHTVLFDYVATRYRDPDPVPIELALDHPYAGLVTLFLDRASGVETEEFETWLAQEPVAELLAGSPIACCSTWRPIPRDSVTSNAPMDLGSGTGGPERTLQMFFVEDDPSRVWDRFVAYSERIRDSGKATVALAAPFHTTIPGTDRYTDALW